MWWKLGAIAGVEVFVLASAGLLCEPPRQEQDTPTPTPPRVELSWVDEKTGKVLFTVADIVRFDWERQLFELERTCSMNLGAWLHTHMRQFRGFVVQDADGIIYHGRFYSNVSSVGYGGPAIYSEIGKPSRGFCQIHAGYPPRRDDDQTRFAPRLLTALQKANVLGEITDEDKVSPIKTTSTSWVGDRPGINVRVTYFPETFRVGEEARAHVFFSASPGYSLSDNEWGIAITLTANEGKFRSELSIPRIELDVEAWQGEGYSKGGYICLFLPWRPASASINTIPKPGPAKITLTVIAKKDGETVGTWETAPCEVSILPPN